ncbi:DNA polymerase epsilon subunit 3 [Hordeum vulgare]|nr:DNA polymerase epsilon subunit 3 [Hordeum vulgare]
MGPKRPGGPGGSDTDLGVKSDSLVEQGMEKDVEIKRANDVCKDGKRQMINAEDVFKALDEIEFPEFLEPLRTALEGEVQSQV